MQEVGQALQLSLVTTKVEGLHDVHIRVEVLAVALTAREQSTQEGSALAKATQVVRH